MQQKGSIVGLPLFRPIIYRTHVSSSILHKMEERVGNARLPTDEKLESEGFTSLAVLQGPLDVSVVADKSSVRDFLEGVVSGQEDPLFAVDLGRLIRLYKKWRDLLPRVDVFYGN